MRRQDRYRYHIAEWYGRSFVLLTPEERKQLAALQFPPRDASQTPLCPFLSRPGKPVTCWKSGGVCSIRIYRQTQEGEVSVAEGALGEPCALCPSRLVEADVSFKWAGDVLLNCPDPFIVAEIPFLERVRPEGADPDEEGREGVGRIDNVLIAKPGTDPLIWCPLEVQAVYFSGKAMDNDFTELLTNEDPLPFPLIVRRPDWRSSGPKRLMPQLQIKVPTLRRWGKKMAVVVDRRFFQSLGRMEQVAQVSNCDIAWFVLTYQDAKDGIHLGRDQVYLTTLESAVIGLTNGVPVSQEVFERRIRLKLAATV